ncbi:MAG: nitrous oxide reductase accessory protein NosL, partial [Salinibacter sp.]
KQLGWTVAAVYVTDYSRVDYKVWTAQDTPYIESATAPDTFADATTVVYVVGSRVHGAMGPEFIPFSAKRDAKAFARKYGGRLVSWEQVTPEMLGR